MSQKASLVAKYTKAYEFVHGVKPKGVNLLSWSIKELEQGLRVLSRNSFIEVSNATKN